MVRSLVRFFPSMMMPPFSSRTRAVHYCREVSVATGGLSPNDGCPGLHKDLGADRIGAHQRQTCLHEAGDGHDTVTWTDLDTGLGR